MKKLLNIVFALAIILSSLNLSIMSSTVEAATDGYFQLQYRAHVQDLGTLPYVSGTAGDYVGTTGLAKNMEALEILSEVPLEYSVYSQGAGWFGASADGYMIGTIGQNKPILDICVAAKDKAKYNVYYRAHIRDFGWGPVVSNGQSVAYQGKPIEAFQITGIVKRY